MKENSIEEDIKDIKKYISFTSKRENFSHDTDWNWNKDLANKIEHILSDYKRTLEENEDLKREIKRQKDINTIINKKVLDKNYENALEKTMDKFLNDNIANEFLPKQKIKDKIEELNKKEQKLQNSISAEEREEYSDANISWDLMDINIKREVLQELIEESEEK